VSPGLQCKQLSRATEGAIIASRESPTFPH